MAAEERERLARISPRRARRSPSPSGGSWEIQRLVGKLRRTLLHLRATTPGVYEITTAFLDVRMDYWLKEERPDTVTVEAPNHLDAGDPPRPPVRKPRKPLRLVPACTVEDDQAGGR